MFKSFVPVANSNHQHLHLHVHFPIFRLQFYTTTLLKKMGLDLGFKLPWNMQDGKRREVETRQRIGGREKRRRQKEQEEWERSRTQRRRHRTREEWYQEEKGDEGDEEVASKQNKGFKRGEEPKENGQEEYAHDEGCEQNQKPERDRMHRQDEGDKGSKQEEDTEAPDTKSSEQESLYHIYEVSWKGLGAAFVRTGPEHLVGTLRGDVWYLRVNEETLGLTVGREKTSYYITYRNQPVTVSSVGYPHVWDRAIKETPLPDFSGDVPLDIFVENAHEYIIHLMQERGYIRVLKAPS